MKTMIQLAAALLIATLGFAAPPDLLNHQGRLLDGSGNPINGQVPAAVALYDAATGGSVIFTQQVGDVEVADGLFQFAWGGPGLDAALTHEEVWLEYHLNGEAMSPRHRVLAVPYARQAATANALAGSQDTLRLTPAAPASFTNAPAAIGTLRLGDDGALYVNTNGAVEGWTALQAGGGAPLSYGELLVAPLTITVTGLVGDTVAAAFSATNSGLDAFDYAASVVYTDGTGWLSVIPPTKILGVGGSFTHDLSINTAGLDAGAYSASVILEGNQYNGPQQVEVTAVVLTTAMQAVVLDDSADFAGGTFSSVVDAGGGTAPVVRLAYDLPFGFGDGHDGDATVSGDPNARVSCSGSLGSTTLTTHSGLGAAPGDVVLVHQSRGTGAGQWHLNRVVSDNTSSLTLELPLPHAYTDSGDSQAQVLLVPQYATATVTGGGPASWNGDRHGLYAIMAREGITIAGTLSATARGYRGGSGRTEDYDQGRRGEGYANGYNDYTRSAAGNSGGGGAHVSASAGGGAGGGHGASGANGSGQNPGYGGGTAGNAELTVAVFGGGGGAGGNGSGLKTSGSGGAGGGLVFLFTDELTVSGGAVQVGGGNGGNASTDNGEVGAGGGGGGGGLFIQAGRAVLGSGAITASGGSRSTYGADGGNGGVGRIRVETGSGGLSGTTSPGASTGTLAYRTTGSYVSPAIALPDVVSLGELDWTWTGGVSVHARTRTAATEAGLTGAAWSDWLTAPGGAITSAPLPWLQVELALTGTGSDPAAVTDLTIAYEAVQQP